MVSGGVGMSYSVVLRDVRVGKGLSQGALAELAGTTQSYVSRIESGVMPPTLDTLVALASVLGCTLDALVVLD